MEEVFRSERKGHWLRAVLSLSSSPVQAMWLGKAGQRPEMLDGLDELEEV